ncbi:hypothetical protein DPMN_065785 [Dreissena polymorpha]|uniref:Uncharacterized protein n=1 Tax=Dreissena polymorpha TaxID=45954 RepID=A0A9D4BSB7_DREPO|nr:hypothetical protein DPMN_065785 [Dreissena polymorpha]
MMQYDVRTSDLRSPTPIKQLSSIIGRRPDGSCFLTVIPAPGQIPVDGAPLAVVESRVFTPRDPLIGR